MKKLLEEGSKRELDTKCSSGHAYSASLHAPNDILDVIDKENIPHRNNYRSLEIVDDETPQGRKHKRDDLVGLIRCVSDAFSKLTTTRSVMDPVIPSNAQLLDCYFPEQRLPSAQFTPSGSTEDMDGRQ